MAGGSYSASDAVQTPKRISISEVTVSGCSTNSACGCALSYDIGYICTQQASCSCAKPCEPWGDCEDANTTCVLDERCGSQWHCYTPNLFSEQSCPPYYAPAGDAMKRPKRHARLGKQA
jgi:hypothetical protein